MLSSLFQSTTIPVLQEVLSFSQARHAVLAGNIANVDTPGYHTRDIDFQGELNRAMSNVLNHSGDDGVTAQLNPVVQEVPNLMERADGNNVNLDREGLLMSETQLQYQMGVQLVKLQFHQMLSAINGGGQ